MRILLVGHGRMGRMVEAIAPDHDVEIAGYLDSSNNARGEGITAERWPHVDAAVDFSTAEALAVNFPRLAALGINVVIGTTGWGEHAAAFRRVAAEAAIGVVAAPNCSLGVALFQELVTHAGRLLARHRDYGAWIHELHHSAKRDAPSGTALALKTAMEAAGYGARIDVASTRAGSIPGTHTIGFDGPSDSIVLTHTTRDRATFARGALAAARWVCGRSGWFTMRDVLTADLAGAEKP